MGGLGNQLFQIFHGLALAKKYNLECKFLPMNVNDKRPDYMDDGNMLNVKMIRDLEVTSIQTNKQIIRVNESVWGRGINLNLFIPRNKDLDNYDFIVTGYWNNSSLFTDQYSRDDVREILGMVGDELKNSTAVHLRFGDYIQLNKIHPVLQFRYYQNALKRIAKKSGDDLDVLLFYKMGGDDERSMFMDYMEKIRNLPFVRSLKHVDGKNERDEIVQMSECKNHVIANSTFSWWGAFLRSNRDGIVCAPRTWFGGEWNGGYNWDCIYEDDWEVL